MDPRRCPIHPHVVTSSEDGMHDAPCGACESEMDSYDAGTDSGPDEFEPDDEADLARRDEGASFIGVPYLARFGQ